MIYLEYINILLLYSWFFLLISLCFIFRWILKWIYILIIWNRLMSTWNKFICHILIRVFLLRINTFHMIKITWLLFKDYTSCSNWYFYELSFLNIIYYFYYWLSYIYFYLLIFSMFYYISFSTSFLSISISLFAIKYLL